MTAPYALITLTVILAAAAAIAGYRHNPHRRRRLRREQAARWQDIRDAGARYHAHRVIADPDAWADFENAHSSDASEQ